MNMAQQEKTRQQKKNVINRFVVIALSAALVITVAVLLHVLFSHSISTLTVEILAAIIAVVLVVASVAVTLHFQSKYEIEREFHVELFRQKLDVYYKLLSEFSKADDDGEVTHQEIVEMRNLARSLALVASADLVIEVANYVTHVDEHRRLYISDNEAPEGGTFRGVVLKMRDDLAVVEGRQGDVSDAIKRLVIASEAQPQGHSTD